MKKNKLCSNDKPAAKTIFQQVVANQSGFTILLKTEAAQVAQIL